MYWTLFGFALNLCIVGALDFIAMPSAAQADLPSRRDFPTGDFKIYSVYRRPDLGTLDERPQKDFYVNMGARDGIVTGSFLKVFRKMPSFDLATSDFYKEVTFPIAILKVIHVESNAAITRLEKFLPLETTPGIFPRAVMLGDLVKLMPASEVMKKKAGQGHGVGQGHGAGKPVATLKLKQPVGNSVKAQGAAAAAQANLPAQVQAQVPAQIPGTASAAQVQGATPVQANLPAQVQAQTPVQVQTGAPVLSQTQAQIPAQIPAQSNTAAPSADTTQQRQQNQQQPQTDIKAAAPATTAKSS